MPQLTGGRVLFKRTMQPEQYGTRGAEVELSFSATEGEGQVDWQAYLAQVADQAQAKCMEMMFAKANTAGKALIAVSKNPENRVEPDGPKVTKPKGKTKADLEAEKKADLAGKANGVKFPAVDPAAVEEPAAEISKNPENRVDPAQVTGTSDDDIFAGTPEPISDMQLIDAVKKKNGKLQIAQGAQAPIRIRALVAEYVAPPKGSRDIPQDKRHEFMTKLEALT